MAATWPSATSSTDRYRGMEQRQVVGVRGARFGTGYLVAPRLVLTASHVVGAENTVSHPDTGERFAAVVRWDGGSLDAALLEITAEDWAPPSTLRGAFGRRPQRWGRLVTGGREVPVAATGFPRQQRTADARDTEELVGRIRPHGGATFEVLDDIGSLGRDDDSDWAGMSGAAVFLLDEKLLLGVLRADRRPRQGTRLTYVRAEDLLARPDFRAVISEATGVEPVAEPAELAELLEPAPPMEVSSPTMLLRADAEVVAFHGRQDVLADLERWCLDGPHGQPLARVLTGPGGQGKTRLARELMARLRRHGWVTGEVHSEPGDPRVLRTVQHPLLLVVDYAESRPELVRRLRTRTEASRHPVRLLLLARSLGSWATKATGALPETRLHALSPDAEDRALAFRRAARDIARRLADVTGRTDVDWPGLAETVPAVTSGAATALTVQMAALVALLRRAPGRDRRPLEAELLEEHESKYWMETAAGRRMGEVDAGLLVQAVAAAVLCPAQDRQEAEATIARLLPHEPPWLVADVTTWLRDLYPPPEGRYWGQLEPDRLGEYHAAAQVLRDPELLPRLFAGAADHQRVQTLTVLARAAVAHANENRTTEAHDLVHQLRALVRDTPLTAAVLRAHSDTLPARTHVLREYVHDVAAALSRRYPAGDRTRDRAWALHNLAGACLGVADWAGAVTAAGEAAAIRETLAREDDTTPHRTEWAESLLVLSDALRVTGRIQEAYQAGDQALVMFRALAAEDGDDKEQRERGLVRALVNQARVVWRLDPETIHFIQVARSDDYTADAVKLARDLDDRHPDLDPLLLTDALAQRSANLWHLRRRPEALAPSVEALANARRLASENPDAYTADLAEALNGLAVDYTTTGRPHAEAMALEQEAIECLRPLVLEFPEGHRSLLARLLANLAWNRLDAGEHEAARASIHQAIEYRRTLARNPYGTGATDLAGAVRMLAAIEADLGNHEAAVAHLREALGLYANTRLPLSVNELMSQSATAIDLARSYAALGRTADALTEAKRAGAILRRLSEYAPHLYAADYTAAMRDLADLYRQQDLRIPERIVLRHALLLAPELARGGRSGRAELGWCLHYLGESYAATWPTRSRAVPRLREAYDLFAELTAEDPGYEADLANVCADLASALLRTSRFTEAVGIAEHEVRLRRRLDQERPLCLALLRLANALTMAGRPRTAWRTAVEAEERCRALADRPGQDPAEVAGLLCQLAETVSRCGRDDVRHAARALPHARRAARIYRRLVDENPHDHQSALIWAVNTLATALTRLGRHTEATAVRLRRGA